MNTIKHIDLFSGIGGFALAAQTVWQEEYVPIIFCDSDSYCQAVLKKHWPPVPVSSTVLALTKRKHTERFGDPGAIDLLTGGFPCQPVSTAGRRRGTADHRYLWPAMLRVIQDFKPTWVIAENVRGLLT